MNQFLRPESVAAIATIVGALIVAAFSFVNMTLSKEQKTSEFRQAWIDALREDLASFFATVRAIARAVHEFRSYGGGSKDGAPFAFSEQFISEQRYRVAETRYRIQLRLNPNEPDHMELLRLMQDAIERQQMAFTNSVPSDDAIRSIEAAASFAPRILKSEWKRVKRGEFAFRLVRNWVAPALWVISLLLVFMLWRGWIHF